MLMSLQLMESVDTSAFNLLQPCCAKNFYSQVRQKFGFSACASDNFQFQIQETYRMLKLAHQVTCPLASSSIRE